MDFAVERRRSGDAVRVTVQGEFDLETGRRVDDELRLAQTDGARRVVLDLTRVTFFDSTGLQVVLDAEVRSRDGGHAFVVVVSEDGEPMRVLRLAEVTDRLTIERPDG
jgi:anti-sigma B factor antagonist